MKNLITGGAGFIGSNLIEKLLLNDEEVFCIDNLETGSIENIDTFIDNKKFKFLKHDVINPINLRFDRLWHLACPGSPAQYKKSPIKTSQTQFIGTLNMLNLARENKATFLLTSSSEVYGDPMLHPQEEKYLGNVNPIGSRSCYQEGKRNSESLCFDFYRTYGLSIRIARIFNTYGPRMKKGDGRVVSNFIYQGLEGDPLTINGDGKQTRSFCFINDIIGGLIKLMNSNYMYPLNLGSENEITILELSDIIKKKLNLEGDSKFLRDPKDDPRKRKPDISLAKRILDWEAQTNLEDGLTQTINYIKKSKC